MEKIQTKVGEDDWNKLNSCIERFLGKEKKMFWIHTFSKVERVYLKNFYEYYKEGWGSRDCGKNQEGNAKYLKWRKVFIVVMLFIMVFYAVFFPFRGISFRDYKNELILLFLAVGIVEIGIVVFSWLGQGPVCRCGVFRVPKNGISVNK